MSITGAITTAVMVGVVGLLIGVLLSIAGEKSKVEMDEREILVRNELPDDNCDDCGYPGCDGPTKAIVGGNAGVGARPVDGAPVADKVAATMGISAGGSEKKAAFVKCKSTYNKTKVQYNYYRLDGYKKTSVVPGVGEKACIYRCMGYDSCTKAYAFGAIHMVDGAVLVDKEKCAIHGRYVTSYPNDLIKLVPYSTEHLVQCNSHDRGKDIKAKCEAGCIGCTPCVKQCEFDAIHMDNNVAIIDYEKCTNCGKCTAKYPAKVIV